MDEIKKAIAVLLRTGHSPVDIKRMLEVAKGELTLVEHYLTAIKEADFRP